MRPLCLSLILVASAACSNDLVPVDTGPGSSDSGDANLDTGTGDGTSDSGTPDGDTGRPDDDTGGDTGPPPPPPFCENPDFEADMESPDGPCHVQSEEVYCGDVIRGSLEGGRNDYTGEVYRGYYQTNGEYDLTEDFAGPERLFYVFTQPRQYVGGILRAYDPKTNKLCDDEKSLFIFSTLSDPTTSDRCPIEDNGAAFASRYERTSPEQEIRTKIVPSIENPGYVVFVVDGLDADSDGNFELEIVCQGP